MLSSYFAMTSHSKGIKSAYERALERLEAQGIERPREEAYSAEVMAQMAEARSKAEAKLAELEILNRKALAQVRDPSQRAQQESRYRSERERIEAERDRKLERLRRTAEKAAEKA